MVRVYAIRYTLFDSFFFAYHVPSSLGFVSSHPAVHLRTRVLFFPSFVSIYIPVDLFIPQDFKRGVGSLSCRLCAAAYQMPIHHLHEPVDVFSEWLDDCEQAAVAGSGGGQQQHQQQHDDDDGGGGGGGIPRYDEDEDEDDEIPESSGMGGGDRKKSAAAAGTPASDGDGRGGEQRRASYQDLGLDDSDDDDSDDE